MVQSAVSVPVQKVWTCALDVLTAQGALCLNIFSDF
jgi:hypothetical protein